MQIRYLVSAIALILAASSPAFAAGGSSFKCWTNRDGVRECGNEVPPEYSQGRTETMNDRGITTKVEKRAKTQAEVAAEQRKKEQADKEAREQKSKHAKQAAYDRVLLRTYLTEDDIVRARNRRTSAIDASVEVTKATMAKLAEKQQGIQKRIDTQKKSGRPVNKMDQKESDDLKEQLTNKQKYIDAKQKEKGEILTEYEGYIQRFRELKGKK